MSGCKGRECADQAHSQLRRVMRAVGGCGLAFLLGVSSGCYVYPPVVTTPSPGSELRLDLNDRGRVALGTLIGPAAVNVEGVLKSPPDTAYVLGVTSVTDFRGQANKWNGEPVTVSKEFVANTTRRTFSKSRTWLTVAMAAAGVAALAVSFGLTGGGTTLPDPGPGGGGGPDAFRGIPGGFGRH